MALKAGRVGVAPEQVDDFGQIKSEATSGYTKQEADAKFETQTNASTEYAKLQPKTLEVPISMLEGSSLSLTTVESVFGTMNGAMTNKALTEKYGRIKYYDLVNSVVDKTGDFSVEISDVPSGDYIVFLRCQARNTGVINSEINAQECGLFNVTYAWDHLTSFTKITVGSNGKVIFHSKTYTTATFGNAKIALVPVG